MESLPHACTRNYLRDDDEFPNLSVAVHVMIVSPSGNTLGASLVIIGESSIISESA